MDQVARGPAPDRPHVVISVHGIRTYGRWQEELERLVRQRDPATTVFNYHYGYFSVLAFLLPPLRWITTMQFGRWMKSVLATTGNARVDIVAHSFGTHLVAWSLRRLVRSTDDLRIHTVIFAGSVLKPGFRWDALTTDQRVFRVVNECGINDRVLVWNQLTVLFTGMAGRVGFVAGVGERFRNRYFALDHSGYFRSESGALSPDFMARYWLPLLTSEAPIIPVDQRPSQPTALQGIATFALNNTEPIKIAAFALPFVLAALYYQSLYERARAQSYRAAIAATQESLSRGSWDDAREFLRLALDNGNEWEARYLERLLDRSESKSTIEALPEWMKRAWRNLPHQISYRGVDAGGPGIFDMSNGNLLEASLVPSDLGPDDRIAASPDRRMLATWQKQGVSIRRLIDGRVLTTTLTERPIEHVSVLRFSDDGRWLAVFGEKREIWDLSAAGRIEPYTLQPAAEPSFPRLPDITPDVIEFDPSSRTVLAWGSESELHIWDRPSGRLEFSSTPEKRQALPGLSHYPRHPWAVSFDGSGNTMYLSLAATRLDAPQTHGSRVTVLAVGRRQASGGWLFTERYIGNIEAIAIAGGAHDPDHFVFSSGNSLYGFVDRESNRIFRLPVPTSGAVGWLGYDEDTHHHVTITTNREVFTWNLEPVERRTQLFAARDWGYVYPLPTSGLQVRGLRATLNEDGFIAFGAREYGRPVVFEYGLEARSLREYDVLPSANTPLRPDDWWKWQVEDVRESPDRRLIYALVLSAEDIRQMDQHKPTAFYVVAWDRGSGQQMRRWRLYPDMENDAPVTAVDANNPSKGFTLRDDAAGDAVLRTPDPQYPHSTLLPNSLRRVTFQATVGRVAAQDRDDVFLNLQAEEYVDGVLSLLGGRVIVGVSGDSAFRAPVVQVWDTAIRPPPVLGWVGRLLNAFARDAITRQ